MCGCCGRGGFLGYAVGGACSTTAFYGFMSASPFIFETQLHQPTQRVGLYYLLLMLGVAGGDGDGCAGRKAAVGAGLAYGLSGEFSYFSTDRAAPIIAKRRSGATHS